MKSIINLIKRYKELISYGIFGVLTTAVNFGSYSVFAYIFKYDKDLANALAIAIAIIFAFITNKLFVFEKTSFKPAVVARELISFVGFRGFTGLINIGMFYLGHTMLSYNDMFCKVVIAVIEVALNYIFSKLIIFKNKKDS